MSCFIFKKIKYINTKKHDFRVLPGKWTIALHAILPILMIHVNVNMI